MKKFVDFEEIKPGEFFTIDFGDFYVCTEYVEDDYKFEANAVNLKDGSFEYFEWNDKVQKVEINFQNMIRKKINPMFKVMMYVNGEWYKYGTYANRNKANEVAMVVRDERECMVQVWEA